MRLQIVSTDDEAGQSIFEHQQERRKQYDERSRQLPSARRRSEDVAAAAQRATEDPQQPIVSPGTPVEIEGQGTMFSGDDELLYATCATPLTSPAQAMQDMEETDMIDDIPELRDSEKESDHVPPAAKRSRSERINNSDNNENL